MLVSIWHCGLNNVLPWVEQNHIGPHRRWYLMHDGQRLNRGSGVALPSLNKGSMHDDQDLMQVAEVDEEIAWPSSGHRFISRPISYPSCKYLGDLHVKENARPGRYHSDHELSKYQDTREAEMVTSEFCDMSYNLNKQSRASVAFAFKGPALLATFRVVLGLMQWLSPWRLWSTDCRTYQGPSSVEIIKALGSG